MKKMNRFALLTLVSGILASALVMGCGGGDTAETTDAAGSNAMSGNAAGNASSNAAANAPAAP